MEGEIERLVEQAGHDVVALVEELGQFEAETENGKIKRKCTTKIKDKEKSRMFP